MEALKYIIVVLGIIFLVILFIIGLALGFTYVDFVLDKSDCAVKVNNQIVYEGRCHFVTVHSIGENGNSKHVTIYKDVLQTQPLAHYVSENVEVK